MRNNLLIAIGGGIVLLIIIIGIFTIRTNPSTNQNANSQKTPTSSELINQQSFTLPSPTLNPIFLKDSTLMLGRMQQLSQINANRPPLSSDEQSAKNKLIAERQNDDTITIQSTFSVQYISAIDQVQVEILTTNITQAKQDAMNWFASQGIPADETCKLPVMFYLNFNVRQQLQGTGVQLDPLPSNC